MADERLRQFPGNMDHCPCWALNETVPKDAGESPPCPEDCEKKAETPL